MDVLRAFGLFALAGLFEIGGGWLVWQWMREERAIAFALVGTAIVALYAFIPPLQHFPEFGRVFAAYGAVFIILSLAWARLFDGLRIDRWDLLGVTLCLAGAVVILWAPHR